MMRGNATLERKGDGLGLAWIQVAPQCLNEWAVDNRVPLDPLGSSNPG
jgi:hypothetical protein